MIDAVIAQECFGVVECHPGSGASEIPRVARKSAILQKIRSAVQLTTNFQ
jgi:hypothetical protein